MENESPINGKIHVWFEEGIIEDTKGQQKIYLEIPNTYLTKKKRKRIPSNEVLCFGSADEEAFLSDSAICIVTFFLCFVHKQLEVG